MVATGTEVERLGRLAAPAMFGLWKRIQEARGIAPHRREPNQVYKKQCVAHVMVGEPGQELPKPCPFDEEHHDARMIAWDALAESDRQQFESLAMIVAKEVGERLG